MTSSVNALLVLAVAVLSVLLVLSIMHPVRSTSSSSLPLLAATCSDEDDLARRVSLAYNHEGHITPEGNGLFAVIDNVISPQDCKRLLESLPPQPYLIGESFSTLTFEDLGYEMEPDDLQFLLQIRNQVKNITERALGLCPNSTKIQYSGLRLRTKAEPWLTTHADKCYMDLGKNRSETTAACRSITRGDQPQPLRYTRKVSNVMFLNDEYEGGEFYIGDQITGKPKLVVQPKAGRLVAFTAGPECPHGSKPLIATESNPDPVRRILAMWYHMNETLPEETLPHITDEMRKTRERTKPFDFLQPKVEEMKKAAEEAAAAEDQKKKKEEEELAKVAAMNWADFEATSDQFASDEDL